MALVGAALGALIVGVTFFSPDRLIRAAGIVIVILLLVVVVLFAGRAVLVLDASGLRRVIGRACPWSEVGRITVADTPQLGPGARMLVVEHRTTGRVCRLGGFTAVGRMALGPLQSRLEMYRDAYGAP